jgi:hypothetical protein
MSNIDTTSDPELDAAILAADKQRESYVFQRLRTRRRMAIVAFAQFVFGGAAIVIGGLLIPSWAPRIDHMATFLSIYFGALGTVIMAYWGIGSYERNSMMGSMFTSTSSSFTSTTPAVPVGLTHPPLMKTPRAAG